MIPTKILIKDILEEQKISLNKLAATLRIKPLTITKILWADEEVCTLKTYMKIHKFRDKMVHNGQRGVV